VRGGKKRNKELKQFCLIVALGGGRVAFWTCGLGLAPKRTKLEALVETKNATRPPNKDFTTSQLYTCLFSSLWDSVSAWSIVGFALEQSGGPKVRWARCVGHRSLLFMPRSAFLMPHLDSAGLRPAHVQHPYLGLDVWLVVVLAKFDLCG